MFNRIMVPVDLTDKNASALIYASKIASCMRQKLRCCMSLKRSKTFR